MKKYIFAIHALLLIVVFTGCGTESTPVYTLTTSVNGEGSINPAGGEFEEGQEVILTATPDEHWIFGGWSGDASGSAATLTITMDRDKSVIGTFSEKEYSINYTINGNGSVEETVIQPKGEYTVGTLVQLTPVPEAGWQFVEWNNWDGEIDEENRIIVTVDGEMNLSLTFEREDFPLIITIEGDGEVVQEIVSTPKTTEYPFETVVQLTSKPNDGWVFMQWGGDISGENNPETIEIDEGKEVTSTFKSIEELLTIEVEGQGTVEVNQESFESDPSRRTVTLTAIPNEGWRFTEWSGDVSSTNEVITVIVDGDIDIRGKFNQLILTEVSPLSQSNVSFHSVRYAGSGRMYASTSEILINDNEDGIWLSEDSGATWSKTYNTEAVFITAAIDDPDLVIAGLRDGGYVISKDGGKSWSSGRINDPFGNSITFTDASAVNKNSPIYLSTRYATRSGIFRSNNLGNSWQYIFSNSDAINTFGSLIEQIEVVSSNPNILYARTGFAHDIIKSTDGGSSFISIKNGLPANITSIGAMRVNPDNGDQLFILNNISGNGGNSWSQQSINANNYFWYNGYLMQATSSSIRKSDNLGGSWQTIVNFGQELEGVSGTPTIEMASESIFLIYNGVPRYRISLDMLKE